MFLKVNSLAIYELSPQRIFAKTLVKAFKDEGITFDYREKDIEYLVSESPRLELGDFGLQFSRFLNKLRKEERNSIINKVKSYLISESNNIVREVLFIHGYMNIKLNEVDLSRLLFTAISNDGENFGLVKTHKPLRIVVEHTSANPVHPLHIGHARNASLGDTLARMLSARGHTVQRRFYINDLGRQVAVLAYAIMKAKLEPPKDVKIDHWLGLVYAIAHTIIDLSRVKRELNRLKEEENLEEYRLKLRELDDLTITLSELREKNPSLFDKIAGALSLEDSHEEEISKIMKEYEEGGDEELRNTIRSIINLCLNGFKETLKRIGVEFDVWDWESNLAWLSYVKRVLEKARNSQYFTIYKGTYALDFKELLSREDIREKLKIDVEVPPLVLMRSDGTTLYTTRDIAYTIKKFEDFNADKVINVIAAEQRLEQLQVKLALIALGYEFMGLNLQHYAYEMVTLPGMSMSGRRGRYISLDELIDKAVERAKMELSKRDRTLSPEDAERIAEAVGVGALRYTLVSTSAQKPIEFDLKEALDFNRNSAPYLQYTYVRAHNILAKYGKPIEWNDIDYTAATESQRRKLLLLSYQFPYVFAKAADEMRPEILVSFANRLADKFNSWYPNDPVIKEVDKGIREFKLALVYTVKIVLSNIMKLLGIPIIERM